MISPRIFWGFLGNSSDCRGWDWPMSIKNASGRDELLPTTNAQVRLLTAAHMPWAGWVTELAIIRRNMGGMMPLSENGVKTWIFGIFWYWA